MFERVHLSEAAASVISFLTTIAMIGGAQAAENLHESHHTLGVVAFVADLAVGSTVAISTALHANHEAQKRLANTTE